MSDLLQKGIYQHYKGFYYAVEDCARHSETLEHMVVYKALYGDYGLWVRPLDMFLETVEIDGATLPRFRYVSAANAETFLKEAHKPANS